jgi:hypothetical protein
MPRPIGKRHQDDVRAKIQCDRILSWLHAGLFDEKFQGKTVILDANKVNVAKALLNKRLPDLQSTTIAGDDDHPLRGVLMWGDPK